MNIDCQIERAYILDDIENLKERISKLELKIKSMMDRASEEAKKTGQLFEYCIDMPSLNSYCRDKYKLYDELEILNEKLNNF